MNELIIFSAKYLFLASIVIWFVCLIQQPRGSKLRFAIFTVGSAALAYLLAKIGSHFISDPRPFVSEHITPLIPHADDNGFPSDHTLITALLAFVVLTRNRLLGGVALAVAVAVGVSRVAAGIHHPLDIAGSIVISAVAVAIAWRAERYINRRLESRQV